MESEKAPDSDASSASRQVGVRYGAVMDVSEGAL